MKKIHIAIGGVIVLVAAITLLLRGNALMYNPLRPEINWRYPSLIAGNADGNGVVLNGRGQQLVFIDRNIQAVGTVCAGLTKKAFCYASSIAMSDDSVYVADCFIEGDSKFAKSVRVIRYSLKGDYLGTVFEQMFDCPIFATRALTSLVYCQGRLYGIACRGDRLEVVEIVDGEMKTIRAVPGEMSAVRGAWYFPSRDQLLVTTFSRNVTLYSGDGSSRRIDAISGLIYSASESPDGGCYLSDRTSRRILRLEEDGSLVNVASAEAFDFEVTGGMLVFSNDQARSLRVCRMSRGGEVYSPKAIRLAPHLLVDSILAWIAMSVCALFFLAVVMVLILRMLKRRGMQAGDSENKSVGMLPLYASNLIMVIFVIVVTTLTMTVSYCADMKSNAEEAWQHNAESLYSISPLAIGDALDRIDIENGCEAEDYRYVRELVCHITNTGLKDGGDLDFMIVRWRANEPLRCLITLSPWQCGFGDVLTPNEEEVLRRKEIADCVDGGKIWNGGSEGIQLTVVPLRNSSGDLAGAAYLVRMKRDYLRMIAGRLTDLSIDLVSILLVLVLLFGEGKLLMDFLKLRRVQIKQGEGMVTRCEAHRPLVILHFMILMLFFSFLPTLAREWALSAGLTAGIFAVLPIIVIYGGDYPLRIFFQERAQRSVRTYYQIGCAVDVLAFSTLIASAFVASYWLLLGSISLLAIGATFTGCCNTAVRACGRAPADAYRMLVFTNMEPAIGTGIGAALGAFVYDKFGLVAVGICALVLTIIMWMVVRIFIQSDINQTGSDETESAGGGSVLRFVLRPQVLAIVCCIVFPIVLAETFQSYTLPLFNDEQGNSVVLIGLALMIIQFLSLFSIPSVLKLVDRIGNSAGMALSMAVVTATVLLYAFIPSMTTILIMVFAFNVLSTVVLTCAERSNISMAKQAGIFYPSAAKFLILGEGVAYAVGGPIFEFLQGFGYRCLGFIIFFVMLLLLGIYLLIGRMCKRP